jgi:putative ABC transport system permease protein
LLYQLGVQDEDAMSHVLGKTIRLEFRTGGPSTNLLLILLNRDTTKVTGEEEKVLASLSKRLPEAFSKLKLAPAEKTALEQLLGRPQAEPAAKETVIVEHYVIRGVLRLITEDEGGRQPWSFVEAGVVLPVAAAEEVFYRVPANRESGFGYAAVEVDNVDHVQEVTAQVRKMGLQAHSLIDLIEREQLIYLLIFTSMTVVAGVSLLVAALGITNTMLMSVLERVREIGIMKAVGGRDGHIQMIFLVEGALVGLAGGLLGLLLGWTASFPGDAWVRSLVQRRLSLNLHESIFAFPWWLVLGTPAFACLVTTLGALYPARRAARIDPVKALRHD